MAKLLEKTKRQLVLNEKFKRLQTFTEAITEAIESDVNINMNWNYSLQEQEETELTVMSRQIVVSYKVYVNITESKFTGTHLQPADDDDVELELDSARVIYLENSNDVPMTNVIAELNKQLSALEGSNL